MALPEHKGPFGHFIDGQEVFEGAVVERRMNPADSQEEVAESWSGTPEIALRAIEIAHAVAESLATKVTRQNRGEAVIRAAAMLEEPEWKDALVQAMVAEIGKTAGGARGEVEKTRKTLQHIGGLGTHSPDRVIHPDNPGVHMYEVTVPVGPAVAITAFNFPVYLQGLKMAPALVAGCPVVVKPSPAAPRSSHLMTQLFHAAIRQTPAFSAAGIGPEVVSLVRGGPDVVEALVRDPRTKALTYTGSTRVGEQLYELAATRRPQLNPRHISCEMGGQNALVVMEDGDIESAVQAVLNGAFMGEGQRCTATSRVFVHKSIYENFTEKLKERTEKLKVGPGKNPESQVGTLISGQALRQVVQDIRHSIDHGMKLLAGGSAIREMDLLRGHFMRPTILEGDPLNLEHKPFHEEIFGPVIGIAPFENMNEVIEMVNVVKQRHAGSIFTNKLDAAFEYVQRANVGMPHVNEGTFGGDAQAGFGGMGGATSFGPKEMGLDCLDPFLERKTVSMKWARGGMTAGQGSK